MSKLIDGLLVLNVNCCQLINNTNISVIIKLLNQILIISGLYCLPFFQKDFFAETVLKLTEPLFAMFKFFAERVLIFNCMIKKYILIHTLKWWHLSDSNRYGISPDRF